MDGNEPAPPIELNSELANVIGAAFLIRYCSGIEKRRDLPSDDAAQAACIVHDNRWSSGVLRADLHGVDEAGIIPLDVERSCAIDDQMATGREGGRDATGDRNFRGGTLNTNGSVRGAAKGDVAVDRGHTGVIGIGCDVAIQRERTVSAAANQQCPILGKRYPVHRAVAEEGNPSGVR